MLEKFIRSPIVGRSRKGFTLIEIMIVVVIIGLLATVAIPAFRKVQLNSRASIIANDFRIFAEALNRYNLQEGAWPADHWVAGAMPSGMDGIMPTAWIRQPVAGGYYAFEQADGKANVILVKNGLKREIIDRIEEIMDDGDQGSGLIQGNSNSVMYVLP